MADDPEILFDVRGRAGLVTLNRPAALNALTLDMVRALHPQLLAWREDPRIERIILRGSGDRAFSAGGDIRRIHRWGKAGDPRAKAFYREEYRLDTCIKRYPKPVLSLIDGIVMGGGVGLSMHGSHRVGTENTLLAMPETGIGLFPDVGATYLLPRLPGRLGLYLGLTGARLGQGDCLWAGLLTHAVSSGVLGEIVEELAEAEDVDAVLERFAEKPEHEIDQRLEVIDRCFGAPDVAGIIAALDAEDDAFAAETATELRGKSPTALKITFRQLSLGAGLTFDEAMALEYRLASRLLDGRDFYEGVRAVIIDKDHRPAWSPSRLDEVTEGGLDRYFAPLGDNEFTSG